MAYFRAASGNFRKTECSSSKNSGSKSGPCLISFFAHIFLPKIVRVRSCFSGSRHHPGSVALPLDEALPPRMRRFCPARLYHDLIVKAGPR
jgi:hypothetical protein